MTLDQVIYIRQAGRMACTMVKSRRTDLGGNIGMAFADILKRLNREGVEIFLYESCTMVRLA